VSAKVQVLSENRQIKRTLALTLVQKQVYEWVVYLSSVRARPLMDYKPTANLHCAPKFQGYEHHIEPRIVKFTPANSEYQRYLL
jgi:hypothetical protein